MAAAVEAMDDHQLTIHALNLQIQIVVPVITIQVDLQAAVTQDILLVLRAVVVTQQIHIHPIIQDTLVSQVTQVIQAILQIIQGTIQNTVRFM